MELREGSRRLIKSTYGQRSETQDSSLKLMSSDTNSYKTMETIKRSMVVRGQRRGTGRAEDMVSRFSHVQLFTTVWTVVHQALLSMRISPGKNTGVGCHALLQGIFSTQRSNSSLPCLLHYRQILYHWTTRKAPSKPSFLRMAYSKSSPYPFQSLSFQFLNHMGRFERHAFSEVQDQAIVSEPKSLIWNLQG